MTAQTTDGTGMARLARSAANALVAVVLFVVVMLMALLAWEYIHLSSTEGDAGYPFGWEGGGPSYATKAAYLAHSRKMVAILGGLAAVMVFGLAKRRYAFAWVGCLAAILLLLIQWAQSVT